MYRAIAYFTDLQDDNYAYNVGDVFPRNGYKPSKERLEELSSNKNVRGVPVIVEKDDIRPNKDAKEVEPTVDPEDVINPPVEADNTEVVEKPKTRAKGKAKKNA